MLGKIPLINIFWPQEPESYQTVLLMREDGSLDFERMRMHIGFILDKTAKKAWQVIHKTMLPRTERADMVMLISERDAIPQDPFGVLGEDETKELTNFAPIARERVHQTYGEAADESKRNLIASGIKLSLMTLACTIVLVVFVGLVNSGTIRFPWS